MKTATPVTSCRRCLLTAAFAWSVPTALAQSTPDLLWMRGGHGHVVANVAYAPDGAHFVTTSGDNTAKVWRASDGLLAHTLHGHTASVNGVAYARDGSTIATAAWDRTVRLWDASSGTLIRTFDDPTIFFNAVALSPDGQWLCAAGGSVGTIRMWNTATGALIRSLTGHSEMVDDLAVSPDGQRIASTSDDDTVRVWNATNGTQIWSQVAHDFRAVGVAFSPDGLLVASAGGVTQPRVKTWNANTGALIRAYAGATHPANDVQFSPDGLRIAGSSGDGRVRIWDVSGGALQVTLSIGVPPTVITSVAFSPDGQQIVAGSNERGVTQWDAVSGDFIREASAHPGWVHGLDFSPDGASVASAAFVIPLLCPVKVFDAATGEQTADLGDNPWGLTDLRYSPDGRYLAGSSGSGVTHLVDLTNQDPDWTIPVAAPPDFPWFARFSPDGTLLATGGTEATVQLWTVTSPPTLVNFLDFGIPDATSAAFAPDKSRLIVGVGCGIVVWNLITGHETIINFPPPCQPVSDIAMATDGSYFFVSHGGGGAPSPRLIRQFSLETLAEVRTFAGHTDAIHSIDISSDGRFLISGGADLTVRMWSVADGALRRTYDQECGEYTTIGAGGVPRVVFSPDAAMFAYGRSDGTVAVARNPFALSPGDMNCDGFVSVGDISGFVLALTDPAGYAAQYPDCTINNGDVNADGVVSVGDIGALVALLVN